MSETKSKVDKNSSSLKGIPSYWRRVNIVVLMIAVFTPWTPGFGEIGSIGNGGSIPFPGWFILMFLILQPPALSPVYFCILFLAYIPKFRPK